jgi:DNA repair exonuclease SbcCD ATPase subunit
MLIFSKNDKLLESSGNSAKLEVFLERLATHFIEETKLVKRVDELNNKHSLCKLSIVNTKILVAQTKQRYGEDHDRTRQVHKELELLYKSDEDFQEKLNNCDQNIEQVQQQREELKQEWEDSDIAKYGKHLLNLQFGQH